MLTVRQAVPAEAATLASLAAAAYGGYVARIGREPAPMSADYAAAIRDGQAWVAVERAQVIGLLVLVPHHDHLLLENVAVLPGAQGRGVGARLLAEAEEHARRLGLAEIRLYTHELMTENISYYQKHGYYEAHRSEERGFRRVFFSKRLAS